MKSNRSIILNAFLIAVLLVSCSSPNDSSTKESSTKVSDSNEPAKIIGTPIKIGTLEVAQNDFPDSMMWSDAIKACADLGSGWRLPTKDELNLLYENKGKIDFVEHKHYWSSTEDINVKRAWRQGFHVGSQAIYHKYNYNYVAAVRTF